MVQGAERMHQRAGRISVPRKGSVLPEVPSFMITTPAAPAAAAFSTFAWNGQAPRRTSATAPRSKRDSRGGYLGSRAHGTALAC